MKDAGNRWRIRAMNPQWETFWKQDLERRAEEARALMERNRCLMDVYKAKMEVCIAIAERAGFTKDHRLCKKWQGNCRTCLQ